MTEEQTDQMLLLLARIASALEAIASRPQPATPANAALTVYPITTYPAATRCANCGGLFSGSHVCGYVKPTYTTAEPIPIR